MSVPAGQAAWHGMFSFSQCKSCGAALSPAAIDKAVADLKSDIVWTSLSFREPLYEYMKGVDTIYREMEDRLEPEIAERLEQARSTGIDPSQRGATWTYLTTDQPFGSATERVMRGLMRKVMKKEMWG